MPPLGREAAPAIYQVNRICGLATASQPSGSKLPRHKGAVCGFRALFRPWLLPSPTIACAVRSARAGSAAGH
ncbi:hypothetical protein C1X64_16640 [Pseudomonas sp. GW456-E7]|nr:hypothetical protein C1X64_16640 [Pseudomonas sp. GW456-E7]